MSRVGKQPVEIPQGVKVSIKDQMIYVEGPKGKLEQDFQPEVTIAVKDNLAQVDITNSSKRARSMHGLYRNLLRNMVVGVSQGYKKALLVNGVGYRAEISGKILVLNLGYSNIIEFGIPEDVTISCEGANKVIVEGINKQRVGQVASEIRSLRPPEPYKGKGVAYEDERILRKVGKSGIK